MSDPLSSETRQQIERASATFLDDVARELQKAQAKHAPMNSGHEAYAVILEELDEFWEEVRAQKLDKAKARKELLQVATMAYRAVVDLGLNDPALLSVPHQEKMEGYFDGTSILMPSVPHQEETREKAFARSDQPQPAVETLTHAATTEAKCESCGVTGAHASYCESARFRGGESRGGGVVGLVADMAGTEISGKITERG